MIKPFKLSLPRVILSLFSLFFIAYSLLDPELLPIWEHEWVFHKKGSEIRHVHADYSAHAFFKHGASSSRGPQVKNHDNLQIITVFISYICCNTINIFSCFVFLFLVAAVILYVRKYRATLFFAYSARSPPLV